MNNLSIRPIQPSDAAMVRAFWQEHWGSDRMLVHGDAYYAQDLPGYVASREQTVLGLVPYRIEGDACEVMSLDSLEEGRGLGSALLNAVTGAARAAGCKRVYLSTTNDNTYALRFYQKRGFRLCALRPGAVSESRRLKPSIPLCGFDGIPIRDEIELELWLEERS
jgi:ribosomal protein S18 acetylase RimI-like enzyme